MGERGDVEHIEFNETDVTPVLLALAELRAAAGGWINFEPGYDEADAPPPRSLLGQAFTARGPDVPLCTWVPPQAHRRWVEPQTIGVHHGAGRRAVDQLAARGVDVPEGWRVMQDHSRRGLVLAVPDDAPDPQIVDWLVEAGTALCPIQLSGWWRAAVHRVQ